MNESPARKKFSLSYSIVMAALVALGLRVVSDDNLRDRLGRTFASLVLMTAGIAVALLVTHVRERVFDRSNG